MIEHAATSHWVFLAHNTRDKPLVERLGHELREHGIEVWLDKWSLVAGRPWLEDLGRAITEAAATLVCVGAAGVGRIAHHEIQVALDAAFRNPARVVIPVLLPGAEGPEILPPFLRARHTIDLRAEGAWRPGVESLVAALQGRPAGPGRAVVRDCPYRGLEAFGEEHARDFFGRADESRRLLDLLRSRRLLILSGASGSGKSSVVLAGIVPAIRHGELDDRDWSVVKT